MRCPPLIRPFGLLGLCAGTLLLASACAHPSGAHPLPREAHSVEALGWPLEHGAISSEFGTRRRGHRHGGIDVRVPYRTPIRAAAAGRVTFSGRMRGYGRVITLDHGDGLETRYAHNHRNLVRKGDWVDGGEVIGEVGSSGNASAPHLHFEVRRDGRAEDPMKFLPPSRAIARR